MKETFEKRRLFVSWAPVDLTQRIYQYVSWGSTAHSTKIHHFSEVSKIKDLPNLTFDLKKE